MIPEVLFEPTVIFFEFTNSPATFQAIINKILKNLINTGEMASFISNIIVGIKKEKRHDEVVKEVVQRLEENDLYVKLEKLSVLLLALYISLLNQYSQLGK